MKGRHVLSSSTSTCPLLSAELAIKDVMEDVMEDGDATMTPGEANQHLKHCMVVYAAYPYFETRVQREAEALIARGHEVDLVCPRLNDDSLIDEHGGVNIHRVKLRWERKQGQVAQILQYLNFVLQTALKLNSLYLKRHYDVIQCHNLPDFLVFSTLLPKLMGAQVILDLHDLMPEFYQGKFKKSAGELLLKLVYLQERWSCRFADHVITVTKHWRETLIKRGVPAEKCSVVMNLADPRIFRPLTRDAAVVNGRLNLFYHGDMPERYGLDLVIRAVAQLREKVPNLRLILIGGGQVLGRLKEMTHELGLDEDTITFIDGVPAENLGPYFEQADVGVVPYRNDIFTDSLLPTKLLEYALIGLPTIAARTTAIAGTFDDEMVLFFKPDDLEDLKSCILLMAENPGCRERYTRGILQFNKLHNWADESAAYAELVEQLAQRRKVKRA